MTLLETGIFLIIVQGLFLSLGSLVSGFLTAMIWCSCLHDVTDNPQNEIKLVWFACHLSVQSNFVRLNAETCVQKKIQTKFDELKTSVIVAMAYPTRQCILRYMLSRRNRDK